MSDRTNNKIGENAEIFYQNLFQSLGYTECRRAIKNSIIDRIGLDLWKIPFNFQIKAGKQKNLSPGKILSLMSLNISCSNVAEIKGFHRFLIHRKSTEDNYNEDIIYMYEYTFNKYKDFLDIDESHVNVIPKRKGFKNDMNIIGIPIRFFIKVFEEEISNNNIK